MVICLERGADLHMAQLMPLPLTVPEKGPLNGCLCVCDLRTPAHSENDSRVYFMIVLTTDYCWRSWTCRIAAPYKFHVD